MIDSDFQALMPVHSSVMPKPQTIASAATIAPQGFLTLVSGTVAIATITPPIAAMHMLCLMFTNAAPAANLTTGNIGVAFTGIQNRPIFLVYEPMAGKYYPMTVA